MSTPREQDQIQDDSRDGDGYERYFGLVESPFALTPNPKFLFRSRSHAEALEQVARAFRRREALVVITGEAGAGKTLLCRTVLQRLEPRTFVCVVTNPLLSSEDLIKQVLDDFGVVSRHPDRFAGASGHDLVRTLQQFLASLAPLHAHAVVMIDEAQHLRPEVLEQIRLLSNFETDAGKLLQIILVGQPELDRLLATPALRQLQQRISRRHKLEPLGAGEVRQYVERRLWIAHGGPDALLDGGDPAFWRVRFTPAAFRAIAELSGGFPRVVNILCDRALENAYLRKKASIDAPDILAAAKLLKLPIPLWVRLTARRSLAAAALALLTAGGAIGYAVLQPGNEASALSTASAVGEASEAEPDPSPPREPAPQGPPPVRAAGPADPMASVVPLPIAESFTIVAASFKTAGRAAGVAAQAAGLGLPAFTRTTAGPWHQVIVGPYASREEAQAAQQRLTAVHLTDTRIVASATDPASASAPPSPARKDE